MRFGPVLFVLLASILGALLFASPVVAESYGDDGAPGVAVPFWDEPAPLCDAPLADLVACDDVQRLTIRDGLVCPAGISDARLAGSRYVHSYADLVLGHQEIEDLATWTSFCVPVSTPANVATSVPLTTPLLVNPQPAIVCPTGSISYAIQGVSYCSSANVAAPAPVFTG